jgi:hypothetical protein
MKRLALLAALALTSGFANATLTCFNPTFGTVAKATVSGDDSITMTFSHYSYKKATLKNLIWRGNHAYYYLKGRVTGIVDRSVITNGHGTIIYYKPYKGGKGGRNTHQRTFVCN